MSDLPRELVTLLRQLQIDEVSAVGEAANLCVGWNVIKSAGARTDDELITRTSDDQEVTLPDLIHNIRTVGKREGCSPEVIDAAITEATAAVVARDYKLSKATALRDQLFHE